MTDQYAELRRALTHYRAEPDSVIAQAMVKRRATPDMVSALLAERDALLSLLREIVESVEERDDPPEWFWLRDARAAIERSEGGAE